MKKDLEFLKKEIEKTEAKIEEINNLCATEINGIVGDSSSRILPYGKQQKLDSVIETHTKTLAKLIVDLEELEELKAEVEKSETKTNKKDA